MTIIAAALGPDGTWLGSDGISIVGDRITSRTTDKWNLSPAGDWAFAGAGLITYDAVLLDDAALWRSIERVTDAQIDNSEGQLLKLMAAMRSTIDEASGAEIVRDEGCVFGDYRFSPLVATTGHIWRLSSDLRSFDRALEGVYQAAGAGDDYAVGAMSALLASGETSAEVLVRAAVETACRTSIHCGGGVFVQRLGIGEETPAHLVPTG